MFLFRFNNYKDLDFIDEHTKILQSKGYVWILKMGRTSNSRKITEIQKHGGYMVLKSPKKGGDFYYLTTFADCQTTQPDNKETYPAYYQELLDDSVGRQWFKVNKLRLLNNNEIQALVLSKTKQPIVEVVGKTRTAFMFIENTINIQE